MAPRKAVPAKTLATHLSTPAPVEPVTTTRKPWIKKTPVDVVLDQIGKQEKKVAAMRAEISREERELAKLQQARKVLEEN